MKRLQRILALILMAALLAAMSIPAFAEEPSFAFEISCDGGSIKQAKTGDVITVMLRLKRADANEAYTMYAMQAETRYDSTFFELIPGSFLTGSGIDITEVELVDHNREVYMSHLSMTGGSKWQADTIVGTFQLRVTGTSGASLITNQDSFVALKDGSGRYESLGRDLQVIVSMECTVSFECNGGSEISAVKVALGDKVAPPQNPVKDGFVFAGWFKDIELTEPWDFEKDTVESNITLYAKWMSSESADPVPVTPDSGGSCCIWCWLILLLLLLLVLWTIYRKYRKAKLTEHEKLK